MKITISFVDNKIKVSNENSTIGEFTLETEVNLTYLVETISESEKEIIITPIKYEDFVDRESQNEDTIKLIEYIYNIINSFNESFRQVAEEAV